MDRFIAQNLLVKKFLPLSLKSNMDRFIAQNLLVKKFLPLSLKSNMDRFIVGSVISTVVTTIAFKIQYG